MQGGLKDKLLALEELNLALLVDEQFHVLPTLNLLGLDQRLKSAQISRMLCHISCENAPYDPLAEGFELLVGKLAAKEVEHWFLKNHKSLSSMIVLLDRDVVVPNGSVCLGVHMIPVSVPIMTQVVTDAGDKE